MSGRQLGGQLRSKARLRFGAINPVSVEPGQRGEDRPLHIDQGMSGPRRATLVAGIIGILESTPTMGANSICLLGRT
jgi:hypothetical protein